MTDELIIEALPRAIDEAHFNAGYAGQWVRLRPSELGHECTRYLYLSFYWATPPEKPDGRVQRVFKRGLREEDRLLDDLRVAGVTVVDKDSATGKQYTVEAVEGHVFGFLDGAAIDPNGRYLPAQEWHVAECKSHSERSFRALEKEGLQKAHPKHFAQMQLYMHITGMPAALYCARNKNNEQDLFIRISYDESYAKRLVKKAEGIVSSAVAPERISADPNFFVCRICPQADVCHGKKKPLRNCRTCVHSQPIAGGKWFCEKRQIELDRMQQAQGCELQRWKPSMINGTQIDVDGTFVKYRMKDGSIFTDAGV